MSEKELTPEKQKEWDELMEQIGAEIDMLSPYAGGYFNNTAVAEEYKMILEKYTEKLNGILGRSDQKEKEILQKSKKKKFSDMIIQNPHGFPDPPRNGKY